MDVITRLKKVLNDTTYKREDENEVRQSFERLDVNVSKIVEEFFLNFAGPFWEETLGVEFLDIVDDEVSIESVTNDSRRYHLLPKEYLVLTKMCANEVVVLNTLNDKVYRVNFEGGYQSLLSEQLNETWQSFEDFLITYFDLF